MIFVRAKGGLCNRLRVINATLKLSRDFKVRPIVFWPQDPEMNCTFNSLFKVPKKIKIVECKYSDLFQRFLFSRYNFLFFHSNAEKIEKMTSVKRTAISTCSEFYGKNDICSGYEWLVPHDEILEEVSKIFSIFERIPIGLHIRRTDNELSTKRSPLELFENAIKYELLQNNETKFFLATDDSNIKEKLLHQFPGAIYTRSHVSKREEANGVRDALVDLLLLSRCTKIYGSFFSSFSEEAAKIGKTEYCQLSI